MTRAGFQRKVYFKNFSFWALIVNIVVNIDMTASFFTFMTSSLLKMIDPCPF